MNIPESQIKAVLCYMITLNQKLSTYQFEMIINNTFRLMRPQFSPGEYYKILLTNSFIRQCEPEGKQREAFELTKQGRDYVSLELNELQDVLGKLKLDFDNFEIISDLEINAPFLKFIIREKMIKILVLLDGYNSKLQIALPNDSIEAVEYIEYLLNDVLNDPDILKKRVKEY